MFQKNSGSINTGVIGIILAIGAIGLGLYSHYSLSQQISKQYDLMILQFQKTDWLSVRTVLRGDIMLFPDFADNVLVESAYVFGFVSKSTPKVEFEGEKLINDLNLGPKIAFYIVKNKNRTPDINYILMRFLATGDLQFVLQKYNEKIDETEQVPLEAVLGVIIVRSRELLSNF